MCMITLVPAGVEIPWDGIINGGITNNDGHGWALAIGDRLIVGKSMILEEALATLETALDEVGKGAVLLFHSRYGTHGIKTDFNVHPFYVGGEGGSTVMAHNGVLPSRWYPAKGDARSDTRKFADNIAGMVANPTGIPSRRGGRTLAEHIGGGNKLTFLSVKSGTPKVRIVNAKAGRFHDGVWFSNSGFEKSKPRGSMYYSMSDADWAAGPSCGTLYGSRGEEITTIGRHPYGGSTLEGLDRLPGTRASTRLAPTFQVADYGCVFCRGVVTGAGYCSECTTCQDCFDTLVDCQCFVPTQHTQTRLDDIGDAPESAGPYLPITDPRRLIGSDAWDWD